MKALATKKTKRAAAAGRNPSVPPAGPGFASPEYRQLLEDTGLPTLLLDRQLQVRVLTRAVMELFGLKTSDVDRPFSRLAAKFFDPRLATDARSVLTHATPVEREITGPGGRVHFRRVLPHGPADGPLAGVVVTFVDVTARKQAEVAFYESERRHRLIFDGIWEYAIFLLDPEGLISSWNSGAERMLGFTSAEAIGQSLALVLTEEDREAGQVAAKLRRARSLGSIREEGWHMRKDGSRFWGNDLLTALSDSDGRPYGFIKVLRDNTDRKVTEELLRQSKNAAEAANAAKDHFLANVSHELRTPLSAALLWAKLLNGPAPVDPAMLREGLDAIEKSAKEQQVLIEELMDISRISAGKLQLLLKKTALVPLMQATLGTIRSLAIERKIALEENLDPALETVRADPQRLRQVLSNLLTNAVKFTPEGGRISVKGQRHGDTVEIQVSDTGRGIARDFLPHIFNRFSQADSADANVAGGLGLGLAISRQLVELHGGTIAASSAGLGHGATFTVRLPLPKMKPVPTNPPVVTPKAPRLSGLHVLLVEDVEETRKVLATVLRQAGAVVVTAESAPRALEEFNARPPDLILSDLGLGKISGHELIQQIRQWEAVQRTPQVPALALTAYADESNRRRALENGFQRCLTKPVEPYALLSTLYALHAAR